MKIEIESEAIDSLKAMTQKLQDERDELLAVVNRFVDHYGNDDVREWMRIRYDADKIIAKCTAKPGVLE